MDKFILSVPKWQGELLFTKELLVFAGVILLMLTGILFCFWGYKYFRTVLFLGIGVVTCYASFLLIEPMTGNLVIRMFLTVSLTFLGICIVYFLDIILGYFLDRLRLRGVLGKNIYLIAAPLGAVIIGLTIYWFIWRGLPAAVVPAVVCGVGGLVFQHSRREKAVRFKCYNDLLRIPRPRANEDGLEYIVMEPTATAGAAVAATVRTGPVSMAADMPKPEFEPELTAEPEPVAVVMPESVPEPELMADVEPVAAVVPESVPEPELVADVEPVAAVVPESVPEPELMADVEPVAAAMPESVEPEPAPEPAAEVEPVVTVEPALQPELEPSTVLTVPEPEPDPDILEDALFVRQMNEYFNNRRQLKQIDIELAAMAASRHAEAVTTAQREAADVMNKAADAMNKAAAAMDRATASQQGDASPGQHRKPHRKQDSRLAKGAAMVAAGIGLFVAGRASKGGDQV